MKALLLCLLLVGCAHSLPPEDYHIEATYCKCDGNTCRLVTEGTNGEGSKVPERKCRGADRLGQGNQEGVQNGASLQQGDPEPVRRKHQYPTYQYSGSSSRGY